MDRMRLYLAAAAAMGIIIAFFPGAITPVWAATAAPALAYIKDGDAWVMRFPDGTPKRLTTNDHADYVYWSQSGAYVLVEGENNMAVVSVASGDTHTFAADWYRDVAWSPVADTLAYVTKDGALRRLDVDDGWRDRELAGDHGVENFAWRPDGQMIAYAYLLGNNPLTVQGTVRRIWADGTGDTCIMGAEGDYRPLVEGWYPNGKWVVVWRDDAFSGSLLEDGVPLDALPASGGEMVRLSDVVTRFDDAWSPDGRTLAVVEGEGREVWVDKHLILVTPGRDKHVEVTGKGVVAQCPAWSPDGRRLAYCAAAETSRTPGGSNPEQPPAFRLTVTEISTMKATPIPGETKSRDAFPAWTTAGDIVFQRTGADGHTGIWWLPNNKQTPALLVPDVSVDEDSTDPFRVIGSPAWDLCRRGRL